MIVVALQFCQKDWTRAAKLATLLADIERRRRDNVCLFFVRAPDFTENSVMDRVFERCSEVFQVEHLLVRPDSPSRQAQWHNLDKWVEGSNILWTAAVERFLEMDARWQTAFFADGGDGAPLHRDWVDMFLEDHERTVRAGLSVTGALRQCRGIQHINGNQVVSRSFLQAHPEFAVVPAVCQEWDVGHAATIVPAARVSSLIYGGWNQFVESPARLEEIACHSAWWHGNKCGSFVDLARDYVLGGDRPRPEIVDLGPASCLQTSRFSS